MLDNITQRHCVNLNRYLLATSITAALKLAAPVAWKYACIYKPVPTAADICNDLHRDINPVV